MTSFAPQMPTVSAAARPQCPWGYQWDPVKKVCFDTVAGVDRLKAQAPATGFTTYAPPGTTMGLNDGFATAGSTIMTIIGLVGAVGGITYLIKANPFGLSFLKKGRRSR